MSRALRVEFPGAIYHVMARGVARMKTFNDDADLTTFLQKIEDLVFNGVLVVHTFCLMINHIHMLCQTPMAGLSRWMQTLLGRYADYYNRRHERVGHLWQGRYKAILVQDGQYLLDCSRYIHRNPVESKVVRAAEHYRWSSYRNYVGGSPETTCVSTELVMSHFPGPESYRAFVETERNGSAFDPFKEATAGLVLGDEHFLIQIRHLAAARDQDREVPSSHRIACSAWTPEPHIVRNAVQSSFPEMSDCQRLQLFGFALYSFTWLKIIEIARILHRTPGAVSQMIRRMSARATEESELERNLELVERRLLQDAAAASHLTRSIQVRCRHARWKLE